MKIVISLLLLMFTSDAAACPSPQPEKMTITISDCSFYDAEIDKEFVKDIQKYIKKTGTSNAEYMTQTINVNTGLIIKAKTKNTAEDTFFFHTDDKYLCSGFPIDKKLQVNIHRTCPEIKFEAPAKLVILR